MKNPFSRPYSPFPSSGNKLISILGFGLFIFLFLFLFEPFGMAGLKLKQAFLVSLGFGLVTTFVLIVFKYLLEPFIARGRWTLGKNIIWDISIASAIGVANYFYISILSQQPFELRYLLLAVWTALLVGSIPVTIIYIITFNRMYRDALKEAAVSPEKVLWKEEILLSAGNPRNELKLNPADIIFICSNDNYITVVSVKGEASTKLTMRGTLKAVEKELSANRRFFRCHKCFIVNLDFAAGVKGHSQNMTIRLHHTATEIPVSRSRANLLSGLLNRS